MSKKDERYAKLVCLLIFLAMGFAGWYQNYEPVPQPSLEQMVKACDRNVDLQSSGLTGR